MKLEKSVRRDRKISRRRGGHREDGRSVFTIQEEQRKRAEKIRREREEKEKRLNED